MTSPIYSTSFAETLSVAMNDFHEALTKRWREKYVEAVKADDYDYPTVIQRPATPTDQQMWEAHTKAARCHIVFGDCAYIKWVEGGQKGSLSAVTCDGDTGVDKPTETSGTPADGGGMVTVPTHIRCGIGDNLKLIDQWAYSERDNVYYKLPLFDTHDLHQLKSAHDGFVKIGSTLGLEAGKGSANVGEFKPIHERELVGKVEDVSAERGRGQDFWAGWTGLAASRAKEGFFSSCIPSLDNQSGITGSLANLYATRAAIIQKGRNDALYWAQWATRSCDDKATVRTDLRNGWNTLTGIGTAVSVLAAASVVGAEVAVAGETLQLVGFLGTTLLPGVATEGYKYEVQDIVNHLNTKIDELNRTLSNLEDEYMGKVSELQSTLYSVHSYNLELYDLTRNNAHGDHNGDGAGDYTANVDDIMRIGESCFEAGDMYNDLLPPMDHTSDADKDLAGQDGKPTRADTAVLDVRDQLRGFLSTTTGRYVVAGKQVEAAARDYANTDADQKDAFDRIMSDWEKSHVDDVHVHGDPDDLAKSTDRGAGHPGQNDGKEYE